MAARKKVVAATPATPPKPKRFEVGYKFPVMATIAAVHDDPDEPSPYRVAMSFWAEEAEDGNDLDFWATAGDIVELESECNPKAKKEYISSKLAEAKAVVDKLTKELASLT